VPLLLRRCAGEYFLTEQQKAAKVQAAKQEQQETRTQESKARREAAFVAPKVGGGVSPHGPAALVGYSGSKTFTMIAPCTRHRPSWCGSVWTPCPYWRPL
jgi:hypothetical protein